MATSVALVGHDSLSVVDDQVQLLGVLGSGYHQLIFGSGHLFLELFQVLSHPLTIDGGTMLLSLHVHLHGPDVSASDSVATWLAVPATGS